MQKVKITQIKSVIHKPEAQRKILAALCLGRIGKSKELPMTDSVKGMVEKVKHLIKVEG
ncbi:MAG: 50S ribosomal protein L30 [Rickettsiales bacterium]|jgi:large subunit ribosomal protein L30|nr:50S ribosomal protein L30 [Rickettsiales bacterium]